MPAIPPQDPRLQRAFDQAPKSDTRDIAQLMAMRENPDLVKLLASLLQGGDPRVGGTLPIGGKAYARGTPQGGDWQSLGSLRAEDAAHDAVMNYNESRLNDEEQRLGLQPGSTMAPNMHQLLRILNALQQRERR